MPLSALALVVLAGLIHASWNIAAKKAGGDVRFAAFTSLVMMVFWAPVGLWLGWQELPHWGLREWALVSTSGALHVVYFIVLLRGYRHADLTVVYPLARGSGPLLSSLVAITVLGEHITTLGLLGIAAVVGGVFLIAGGPALWRAAHAPEQRQRLPVKLVEGDAILRAMLAPAQPRVKRLGRRQIGDFYLAGDIFGLETGPRHRFAAEAVRDSLVSALAGCL